MLDNFVSWHVRGCHVADGKCTCGRDEAASELDRLKAQIVKLNSDKKKIWEVALLTLEGSNAVIDKLTIKAEELQDATNFHPRAMKLISKRKNFVVVAEDEPYFWEVYAKIRAYETRKETWSADDERNFQDAWSSHET